MLSEDDNGKARRHRSSSSKEAKADSVATIVNPKNMLQESVPYDRFTPMALQMAISRDEAKK